MAAAAVAALEAPARKALRCALVPGDERDARTRYLLDALEIDVFLLDIDERRHALRVVWRGLEGADRAAFIDAVNRP